MSDMAGDIVPMKDPYRASTSAGAMPLMSTGLQVIRWEDPPPKSHVPAVRDWSAVIAELRANPGAWALVHVVPKEQDRLIRLLRTQIAEGALLAFRPKGSFEAAGRVVGDETRLYARWVGPCRPT